MHSNPGRKVSLQLIDSLYRGGAQKVVLEIVRALPDIKHIVGYWEEQDDLKAEFESAGAQLVKIPFRGMKSFPECASFVLRLIRTQKVTHIHSHMFVPNLLARLAKSKSVKTITTYHGECFNRGGLVGRAILMLERHTIHRADVLIAVSDYLSHYVKRNLKTKREVNTIYNFARHSSKPGKFNEQSTTLDLVATSNNQPYKNYPVLLHAMSMLQSYPVTLHIYGSGMAPLIRTAETLGLKNVTFQGSVSDVMEILPLYDVYVAPSHSGEGFSLSMLEAMSAGLLVVCSDIPQFIEAIGDAGIIFHRHDPADLRNKIVHVLNERASAASKARAGFERSKLFSRERFTQAIRKVYN